MAFVWAEGDVRKYGMVMSQPFPAGAGGALALAEDYAPAYLEIWRRHSSVRTVISFLARNIAQLGLHVYQRKSDTERVRVTTGALADLIETPNPWTTRYRWLDALVHDLAIYNRAGYRKLRNTDGDRLRVVRIDPRNLTVEYDVWGRPDKFTVRYTGSRGSREEELGPDEVLFFRGYEDAVSPLEALRQSLAEEWAASVMRQQVFRNGARVSGYLERPKDAPRWNDETRRKFREQWQAQYVGASAERPGGTPLLEDGMTFKPAAQTSEELQYIEARKLTREEVAAAYFIPPPMVGILDHATFSNVREQHKNLYQDTLGPWLSMISDELALQLLPDLAVPAGTYVEFNLAEKLRGSFEEQAAQKQKAVGGPWMTRNEARALDNLPPVEGGDELIVPLSVTSGGQSDPSDTAPDEPDNEESNRDQ